MNRLNKKPKRLLAALTGRQVRLGLLATLVLPTCDSPTAPSGPNTDVVDEYRAGGMLFTASARRLATDSLEITLSVHNETDSDNTIGILGGNCMLRPRVYTERDGRLLWSAFDLYNACQEPLRLFQLGGGDTGAEVRTFAADVVPGDYFVTLTIEHEGLVELAAGTISFR